MALISCYGCGKQISDKASKCPHCGYTVGTAYPAQPTQPMYTQPTYAQPMYGQVKKSKTPVIIGVAVGGFLLFSVIVAILIPMRNGGEALNSAPTVSAGGGTQNGSQGGSQNGSYGNAQYSVQSSEPQEKTYNVTLHVECRKNLNANQYDVDILVDGEPIATLAHGATDDYDVQLNEGTHKVEFRINGKHSVVTGGGDIYDPTVSDTFKVKNIRVSKDAVYSYRAKLVWGNGIEVEQIT